jgi:hypothetical protein
MMALVPIVGPGAPYVARHTRGHAPRNGGSPPSPFGRRWVYTRCMQAGCPGDRSGDRTTSGNGHWRVLRSEVPCPVGCLGCIVQRPSEPAMQSSDFQSAQKPIRARMWCHCGAYVKPAITRGHPYYLSPYRGRLEQRPRKYNDCGSETTAQADAFPPAGGANRQVLISQRTARGTRSSRDQYEGGRKPPNHD